MAKKQRATETVIPPAPRDVGGPIMINLADIGDAWDRVDRAIGSLLVSQPHGMTQAAAELQHEQREFREALRNAVFSRIRKE